MRVPLDWLHEFCAPQLATGELAQRLTMTGTKVEAIHHHGVGAGQGFVVGRVLDRRQHPDADRLSVCLVDIGQSEPAQIVCGAPNVAAGQTVAVAQPGATLPDGTTLTKRTLRGVESNGMILAEDELAIGPDHDGIIVLDAGTAEPGAPLERILPIATEVLELEITSNRPDCLGIYGVAREVHAVTQTPVQPPPWSQDPGSVDTEPEGIKVSVECPELCPRFTARVFEGVEIGPSPPWLKARLTAAGQRPISNVVDITNYVMLLTGNPVHAFDLDRIAGHTLNVRRARQGEQLQTLDGQTRTLDPDMVLIEDAGGPTSIAGVMGGARSEVADDTTRVLMEVATWDGPTIHHTSWTLGLQSEASVRFEKQLQPEQAMQAQAVATQLMLEVCGARLAPGTIDVGGPGAEPDTIRLREARIESLLGAPISRERCEQVLRALEFETAPAAGGLDVTVPVFRRGDVTREVDLIEEVARLDGLEKLPATLPSRHGAAGRLTPTQRLRRGAADALTAQGLHEVVGWSFIAPDTPQRLRSLHSDTIALENPMSSDQSQLRTTLLGSLLEVARRNRAHGAITIRLFETGAVYLPTDGERLPREPYCVGGVLIGPSRAPTWRDPRPPDADFFAVKGVVQTLLDALRVPFVLERAQAPFVHPGRAAHLHTEGRKLGWLGELHPAVTAEWDIDTTVAAFELDLDAIEAQPVRQFEDLATFPDVREDLAVVVPADVSAARVLAVVHEAGEPLLELAEVFDVYRDPDKLGEGNVSLALRLAYRAPDRTLTDEEVAHQRQQIARALSEGLNGRVRDA